MNKININKLYACSEVATSSELFYICELGKHLKTHGCVLDITDISINKSVRLSKFWKYFAFCLEKGYITGLDKEGLDLSYEMRDLDLIYTEEFNEDRKPIFTEKGNVWDWYYKNTSDISYKNAILFGSNDFSQVLTSIVAYAMINRYISGVPEKLIVHLEDEKVFRSIADLLILETCSDALLDWCELDVENREKYAYDAYVYGKKEKGLFKTFVGVDEKRDYFSKVYKKGDIVLLYKRDVKRQSSKTLIEESHVAIIEGVSKAGVRFNIVPRLRTKVDDEERFKKYKEATKSLYVGKSYTNLNLRQETISWLDLGVKNLLYKEEYFIQDIINFDESLLMCIKVNEEVKKVDLDLHEAIYWVLCDRDIKFNRTSYKAKYFKGKTPLYDKWESGEDISQYLK